MFLVTYIVLRGYPAHYHYIHKMHPTSNKRSTGAMYLSGCTCFRGTTLDSIPSRPREATLSTQLFSDADLLRKFPIIPRTIHIHPRVSHGL